MQGALGTRNRNRTGTTFRLLVFETSASTYSAIRAFSVLCGFWFCGCKCNKKMIHSKSKFCGKPDYNILLNFPLPLMLIG